MKKMMTISGMMIVMSLLLMFQINARADLSDGLVAQYRFDGDATDASGSGNNGIVGGGVSFSEGIIGQSAFFEDESDKFFACDIRWYLLS